MGKKKRKTHEKKNVESKLNSGLYGSSSSIPITLDKKKKFMLYTNGCSYNHTVFVNKEGKPTSFGKNDNFQLFSKKINELNKGISFNPIVSSDFPKVQIAKISLGANHTVFLSTNNLVWTIGENEVGQCGYINRNRKLGNSKHNEKEFIVEKLKTKKTIDIACGYVHSLFVTMEEKGRKVIYSCGGNTYGQLGINSKSNRFLPTRVLLDEQIGSLYGGINVSVFLTEIGDIYLAGELTEDMESFMVPNKVKTSEKFKQLSMGYQFYLALSTKGVVFGHGDSSFGVLFAERLEITDLSSFMVDPRTGNPFEIESMSCGAFHALLVSKNGDVFGMGYGGGLGANVQEYKSKKACAFVKNNIVQVNCGGDGSFFFDRDGRCYVTGSNGEGQLGLKDIQIKKHENIRRIQTIEECEYISRNVMRCKGQFEIDRHFLFLQKIWKRNLSYLDIVVVTT